MKKKKKDYNMKSYLKYSLILHIITKMLTKVTKTKLKGLKLSERQSGHTHNPPRDKC